MRAASPGRQSAPMSTPVFPFPLSGGAWRIFLTHATTVARNLSTSEACTKKRSAPMQFWPDAPKAPRSACCANVSTAAPGRRTNGSLPPSSSVTGVSVAAAWRITSLPTLVEPTKVRWSTQRVSAAPASP